MPQNIDQWRRKDGTIDLVIMYAHLIGPPSYDVISFFSTMETIHPIRSRQAAAIAIAVAKNGVLRHANG